MVAHVQTTMKLRPKSPETLELVQKQAAEQGEQPIQADRTGPILLALVCFSFAGLCAVIVPIWHEETFWLILGAGGLAALTGLIIVIMLLLGRN